MKVMMQLSTYSEARAWSRELPDGNYQPTDVLERSLEAEQSAQGASRCAAAEVFIPTGGRALYGLLGGSFSPLPAGQIVVQVAVSNREGRRIEWALGSRIDDIRVGLPLEYASFILDDLVHRRDVGNLGHGVLRFDHAAHGAVGSSPAIFRRLATVVVQMLIIPVPTEEQITAIVAQEFGR